MSAVPPGEPKSLAEERSAIDKSVENPLLSDLAELVHQLWQQHEGQSESAEADWREAEQRLSR